ncbi:DUF6191 domain-containing protein [Streptomyces sp. NPDC059759]|uniref:DUF6191 domain-containing protein n=1 Tax=Streptomyces sp. NPDC059759 TaxID=3346936 RepID=UPI003657478F
MFEELFAPGRKHTNDERKRLELSRVDLNDGDPGRGPIDLTSGKVVVRAPRHDEDVETDPADEKDPAQDQEAAPAKDATQDQNPDPDRDAAPENPDPPQAS